MCFFQTYIYNSHFAFFEKLFYCYEYRLREIFVKTRVLFSSIMKLGAAARGVL